MYDSTVVLMSVEKSGIAKQQHTKVCLFSLDRKFPFSCCSNVQLVQRGQGETWPLSRYIPSQQHRINAQCRPNHSPHWETSVDAASAEQMIWFRLRRYPGIQPERIPARSCFNRIQLGGWTNGSLLTYSLLLSKRHLSFTSLHMAVCVCVCVTGIVSSCREIKQSNLISATTQGFIDELSSIS